MIGTKQRESVIRLLVGVSLLLMFWRPVEAEQLPIKTYTTADGLLRDSVFRIKQDTRGFLWFCTQGGLSRFDGYGFTNYTMNDGLPYPSVNDLTEASDGAIWIATSNGLVRFNPRGARAQYSPQPDQGHDLMFEVFVPGSERLDREISVLLADEDGVVWVGTANGLYRMQVRDGRPQFQKTAIAYHATSLLKDHRSGLWVGTFRDGLYRLAADGGSIVQVFTSSEGLPKVYGQRSARVTSLLEDKAGSIWVGAQGICQLTFDSRSNRFAVARKYDRRDGLAYNGVTSLLQSSDGGLWIGTGKGLNRASDIDAAGNLTFRSFSTAQGFCDDGILDLAEDGGGALWLATSCGLKKWTPSGFTSYDIKDGLSSLRINSFLESIDGAMIVTDHTRERTLNLFSGTKFKAIRPNYPSGIAYWGWGWRQTVLQAHDGEWWITVGMSDEYKKRFKEMAPEGPLVVRFPRVDKIEDLARISPKAVYRPRDGLLGYDAFRIYEDRHGDVWIVTLDPTRLFKWERRTETFQELTGAADIGEIGYVQVFREDSAGNLWIGGDVNSRRDPNRTLSLMRYRDGRFSWFTAADGMPEGTVRDLLVDRAGRLWMATGRGGVLRVDDPNAERLRFVAYSTAQGLSDNSTSSLTEDRFGRIYIGSGRGVDRLDPVTGAIKHFTTADGLPRDEIYFSYSDRTGALWFGSVQGLARYVPEPERRREAPNVLLTGLRVSNEARSVSALGESDLASFEFGAAQNNLSVDFVGLGADLGEELRYQYKLEGANADWTTTTQRTLNFSNLSPAKYRFLVKAVTAEGIESTNPAVFSFTILRPIWQRWWFLTIAVGLVAAAVYALYRYRVAQIIKIERVRMRIATDLHDDIGSSLSQIAILSEVAQHQLGTDRRAAAEPLTVIAQTSRELVDSMSDIVWAINPRRDSLRDLTQRMRQFATDVFTAKDIDFEFMAPEDSDSVKLETDVRREVFLIFKESVNNIVRHSQSARANITFSLNQGSLVLKVGDEGRGFDVEAESRGHGLFSMRQRAKNVAGDLAVTSNQGQGTTVTLQVPLGTQRRRFSFKKYPPE